MEARVRENGKVIGRVSGIEKESLFTERERAGYCPLRRMHRRIKGFCAMDERWWRRNNALFRPLPIFLPSSHTCPHRTQIFLSPLSRIYTPSARIALTVASQMKALFRRIDKINRLPRTIVE